MLKDNDGSREYIFLPLLAFFNLELKFQLKVSSGCHDLM